MVIRQLSCRDRSVIGESDVAKSANSFTVGETEVTTLEAELTVSIISKVTIFYKGRILMLEGRKCLCAPSY